MDDVKRDESEKGAQTPGQDESNKHEALTPEVVDSPQKKPRYAPGSRKGKGGRPQIDTLLDRPAVLNFIQYLIRRKESDREIARQVNVPKASFDRWKKKNLELWAIEIEDDQSDLQRVKRSLVDRATGHWVERATYNKDGTFKGTKFQYYPPSDQAIQYYLNNRDPANWKSKVEHNHALEELPFAVNFVRASDKKIKKEVRAITDDFGNAVIVSDDDNQGNS